MRLYATAADGSGTIAPAAPEGGAGALDGEAWAVWGGNILEASPPTRAGGTVVAWSGWLGERDANAGFLFPYDPDVWMGAGWRDLCARLGEVLPACEREGCRLALRPHARHVVSDVPTVLRLLGAFPSRALGVVLDPAAMLTAPMADDAGEHVGRILAALAGHERVWAVLLTGAERPAIAPDAMDHDDQLVPCPLTRGALDYHELREALATNAGVLRDADLVLLDEDVAAQAQLLEASGVLPSSSGVGGG